MLKEFIEHIQKTAQPTIRVEEGRTYIVATDGSYREMVPRAIAPDGIELNSLDALVTLVRTEAARLEEGSPLYVTMPDHLTVKCFSSPDPSQRFHRTLYYTARATDVPGWDEKVQLPFEEAQIALRTRFQETQDTLYAMKLLSDITCGAKITYNDNGVATSVVTRKGIDLQANESIRPIVKLRPYRTFQEVEQPESIFLIRISERGISFIEADGGMWKLHARQTVGEWLKEKLKVCIDRGLVMVAL